MSVLNDHTERCGHYRSNELFPAGVLPVAGEGGTACYGAGQRRYFREADLRGGAARIAELFFKEPSDEWIQAANTVEDYEIEFAGVNLRASYGFPNGPDERLRTVVLMATARASGMDLLDLDHSRLGAHNVTGSRNRPSPTW